MSRRRLLTIPFSHYCEKARWILERSGLDFEERQFLPVLHMAGTLPLGGRSVPLLQAGTDRFTNSTEIALYVDSLTDPARRLYPSESVARRAALELEDSFDHQLGPHSRRWIYFHLLNDRELALNFIERFGGGVQLSVFRTGFPVFAAMMKRAMRIDAESARRSLGCLRDVFAGVSRTLSDGRTYLLGDRLSIADLTFASLAAPVVFPLNYGGPRLPRLGEVPGALESEVEAFRATPAGRFVLRIYEEQRL